MAQRGDLEGPARRLTAVRASELGGARAIGSGARPLASAFVRTEPLEIDGIAGPLVLTINTFTGKHSMTAGQQELVSRQGWYTIPTVDGGVVEGRLRSSLFETYPMLEIEGVRHRTGPVVPLVLKILMLLPVVLLYSGCPGGLMAGIAITTNMAITRTRLHTAIRAAMMVGVLIVAFLFLVTLVVFLQQQAPAT